MRDPKRSLFILLVILAVTGIARADEVDTLIARWMKSRQIPGVALVVVKNGEVLKSANYGLANVEHNVPVTDETSFEIASMTKQFTAAAVLLLAEAGKLKLDESISAYLDGLPLTWREITVRQLLNHTSGLHDDWNSNNEFFLTKNSDSAFLKALSESRLKFSPGERYAYSCGPFVAGLIISKVTGASYADFLQKRIFDPLQMRSTHVIDANRIVPHRASGYIVRDGRLTNGVLISPAAHARADVGIRTTAKDLVRWSNALDDTRLLKPGSLREMFSFAKLKNGTFAPAGLGWWLNPVRGFPVQHHGGAFRTGFNSTINRYPTEKLTVILLANRFRAAANDMGHMIAGAYIREMRSLAGRTPSADPNPKRSQDLRKLLSSLEKGDEDLPGMAESFPYRYYESEDWQQLLLEGGKDLTFIGCDDIRKRRIAYFGQAVSEICFYQISAKEERFVSFLINPEGKVVYIEPYEY
jgi:CubicO group peptidase (beta-lactamase class C family)